MRPERAQTALLVSFASVLVVLTIVVVLTGSIVALSILLAMPVAALGWLKVLRDRVAVSGHSELPRYLSARALHQLARELNVTAKAAAKAQELWGAPPQEAERVRAVAERLRPFLAWSERAGEWRVTGQKHPKFLAVRMQEATRELREVQRRLQPVVREGVAALRRQGTERVRALHARRLVARLPPTPRPDPLEGASLEALLLKAHDARVALDLTVREALDTLSRAGLPPEAEAAKAHADRGRPDLAADAILARPAASVNARSVPRVK